MCSCWPQLYPRGFHFVLGCSIINDRNDHNGVHDDVRSGRPQDACGHRNRLGSAPGGPPGVPDGYVTVDLCRVRGWSETSNRGMRPNKHFREAARELGMEGPEGQPPHSTRGSSPVPLTKVAVKGYGPLLTPWARIWTGWWSAWSWSPPRSRAGPGPRSPSNARVRTATHVPDWPAHRIPGGCRCEVCGAEFTEKGPPSGARPVRWPRSIETRGEHGGQGG